jgi:hypothetical protein
MEFLLVFTICLAIAAAGVVGYDLYKMKKDDQKF